MRVLEQKVKELAQPGKTDRVIADELAEMGYEITPNWVTKIRKKLGIPSGCGWGGVRYKGTRYRHQGTNPR